MPCPKRIILLIWKPALLYPMCTNLRGNDAARTQALKAVLTREKDARKTLYNDGIVKWLAQARYKLGDYRRAYELMEILNTIQSQTASNANARLNTELEAKYQAAQKEKELSQKQLQLAQKDLQIQKSRNYVYITVAALLVVLLLAIFLFLQSRYKKREHWRELRSVQQQKELQFLHAMMQVEEKERNRIAKDLHDGVAGMLAAVRMHFHSLASQNSNAVQQSEGSRRGMQLLDEAAQEIRKTSHNLMPEVLLQHGLEEALRRYSASISNAESLVIQYDSWGPRKRLTDNFELSVYRIVQELLNNIVKHSKATQAIVQVNQQQEILYITIEDNGVGISEADLSSGGMGLLNLRSRIHAINGAMELETIRGNGVSIYLEFETTGLEKEPEHANNDCSSLPLPGQFQNDKAFF